MSIEHLRVPAEQLTKVCDPEELGFETTDEVAPLEGTIGQERAVSALEMGLNIDQPGFNIFVAGLPARAATPRCARTLSGPRWGSRFRPTGGTSTTSRTHPSPWR